MGPAGAADFRVSAPEKVRACYGCGREIEGEQVLHLPALAKEGIYNAVCPACHIDMNRTNVFRLVTRCVTDAVIGKQEPAHDVGCSCPECQKRFDDAVREVREVSKMRQRQLDEITRPVEFPRLTDDDPWRHRSAGMRCRTCMWFVPKAPQAPESPTLREVGRCRRHAPAMGGYPAVKRDDWCGDHRLDENKA